MKRPFLFLLAASLAAIASFATSAQAAGPCGNLDLSAKLDCSIKVKADCSASCGVDKLTASCSGQCNLQADTKCSKDQCGTQCIAECDPKLLDCFKGCHEECDSDAIALCKQKHPGEDCVAQGTAQCDIHCKDNCKVPDTTCEEHCNRCCTGACQTQVNFDCDYGCTVDVKAHCNAKCSSVSGGIFCNGQYVDATDVEACLSYLATQSVKVDTSARASGTASCGLDGCQGAADTVTKASGCSTAAPGSQPLALCALALCTLAAGLVARRRR